MDSALQSFDVDSLAIAELEGLLDVLMDLNFFMAVLGQGMISGATNETSSVFWITRSLASFLILTQKGWMSLQP